MDCALAVWKSSLADTDREISMARDVFTIIRHSERLE